MIGTASVGLSKRRSAPLDAAQDVRERAAREGEPRDREDHAAAGAADFRAGRDDHLGALAASTARAYLAFATAHVWAERFDVAIPETELAIELDPSNARARAGLGNRLELIGRTDEGIAHLEAGLRRHRLLG